jgi:CRP-like cAMP-binding protein
VDAGRIAAIPLFASLEPEQLERLAGHVEAVEVDAGTVLATEGDFGYAMFAIEEGAAEVSRGGEAIATLGPGDVFGEVAVLASGRRIASVVALSRMRLLTLLNRDVWRLERDAPAVVEALRETVESRREETLGASDPA